MPLIRAYSGRVIHQAREPGQIVFHHRPEGHLAIHESEPTADRNDDSNSSGQQLTAAIGDSALRARAREMPRTVINSQPSLPAATEDQGRRGGSRHARQQNVRTGWRTASLPYASLVLLGDDPDQYSYDR